jgi:hypothetical protein
MFVLTVLLGLAAVAALIYGVNRFDGHVQQKFGHRFFTKPAWISMLVAVGLAYTGGILYKLAREHNGDTLNGIVLILIGVVIAAILARQNFLRTNPLYGIGGTLGQFFILGILAENALPFLILYAVVTVVVWYRATPVYVVNK